MNRFMQNQIRANKIGELNNQLSLSMKAARKYYSKAGAAILAIIILHFVSQITFLRNENLVSERASAKTENKQNNEQINEHINEQSVEIKPEYEAKDSRILKAPAPLVPSNVQRNTENVPQRLAVKKKEPRESRAERLRRAERILTGA